jgi:hypothetical protein
MKPTTEALPLFATLFGTQSLVVGRLSHLS